MSTDAVEDTAVELSTIDERKRIEWAHEYGLIAIVPSREQLDYILQSEIYHSPYDKHRKWGLRLRADFILFLLSESKFPGQSGVAYQAEIKSVHFGDRREIIPPPPASQRGMDVAQHLRLGLRSCAVMHFLRTGFRHRQSDGCLAKAKPLSKI